MTALSLGLLLIFLALVIYVIAILIAKVFGGRIIKKSIFSLRKRDFLYVIPFFILWLAAGVSLGIGTGSLIVALLQYLGIL